MLICANSYFCALKYCVKCDVRTAILKFDVQSAFAISRRIYETEKTQLIHLYTDFSKCIYACTFQICLILNKFSRNRKIAHM